MACFRGKENRAGRTSPKIFTKPVSMYINITTTETGNNKGSSGGLVQYLEKENRQQLEQKKPLQPEYWFNSQRSNIKPHEVRRKIDNNIGKLSKNDNKFFLVNIRSEERRAG